MAVYQFADRGDVHVGLNVKFGRQKLFCAQAKTFAHDVLCGSREPSELTAHVAFQRGGRGGARAIYHRFAVSFVKAGGGSESRCVVT